MALQLLLGWGVDPSGASRLLTFSVTYLAHSLLLAALAALLVRYGSVSSSTRHSCWKLALFGPLLTALLATAAAGHFGRALGRLSYVQEISVPSFGAQNIASVPSGSRAANAASGEPSPAAGSVEARVQLVAFAAAGATALGLARFFMAAWFVARRLRGRKPVLDARLLGRLSALLARVRPRAVKLSECANVSSPLVIGAAEICVPRGMLARFSDAEVDTVLAHELAHLERGDGLWFPIAAALRSGLWLHPLNHLLFVQFQQSAELACDDRAVELTRDPLGLARALVRVAAGASFNRRWAVLPTMGRSKNSLLPRVRRLTSPASCCKRQPSARGRAWGIAAVVALGLALVGSSVRVAQARPTRTAHEAASSHLLGSVELSVDATAALPDAAEQSRRMAELVEQERQISKELAAAQSSPQADLTGSPDSVRTLELSQELSHVQATEAWLEQRFVEQWGASKKSGITARPASR